MDEAPRKRWPEGTQLLGYRWIDPTSGVLEPAIDIRLHVSPDTIPERLGYQLQHAVRALLTQLTNGTNNAPQGSSNTESQGRTGD